MTGETPSSALAPAAGEAAALEPLLADLEIRSYRLGAALSRAFADAASGAKGLDEVLKGLALKLSSLALDAGLKPLEDLLSRAGGQLLAGLSGADAPAVTPFADGGVIAAPAYFTGAGGGLGLMGEAGPEAILPLRRGADGSLGVSVSGGAPPGGTVVFNVTAADAESFRRSEAALSAMLARAARRGARHL